MNTNMQGQQQTAPQPPNIDPRTFAALNELDTFLARAPLTRSEHQQAGNLMQFLIGRLEQLQKTADALTAELSSLKASAEKQAASKAASEALDAVLPKEKGPK